MRLLLATAAAAVALTAPARGESIDRGLAARIVGEGANQFEIVPHSEYPFDSIGAGVADPSAYTDADDH